jgi:MFS family permease
MPGPDTRRESQFPESSVGGAYPRYVLAVLVLVYVFNFLDRQIITVLAEDLKADLDLSDAQIGFLYGTAFAVFYAIFGIPLGKVADVWNRRALISLGLAFWSAMTALSGTARSFVTLAGARIGVGVGEASASPAAFSLLSDYFPPAVRTTVLAIYSSGIYLGAGIGIFLGGWILSIWHGWYPDPALAPFGLKGWQVAFFAVGLPGLVMALWVRTLREPVRGGSDGLIAAPSSERPLAAFWGELRSLLPGFSLFALAGAGGGRPVLLANLGALGAIALGAWLLILWLGTPEQWIALGIGLYAAVSWAQGLVLRDPPAFALIFRSPALRYSCLGFSCVAFTGYGIGAFAPPFFMRVHGVGPAEVGTVIGLTAAIAGWLGVTLGGVASDALRRRWRNARLYVAIFTALFPLPFAIWMLTTGNTWLAYGLNFVVSITAGMWIGPGAATVQDLVLPRMRAVASASYLLVLTFIGLALGPYTVGRLSVAFDSLRAGMILSLAVNLLAVFFLLLAARHMAADEGSKLERARAAGEPG